MDEVPVAALDGEAVRDSHEPGEQGNERKIDILRPDQLLQLTVCLCPLLLKIRVFNQGFFSGESLHGWRDNLSYQGYDNQRQ